LNNPELRIKMGKRGREKVLKEFNEELVLRRMKLEYARLIKEKL